eukprot:9172860-Alexandrium_andersonii.AAC.1
MEGRGSLRRRVCHGLHPKAGLSQGLVLSGLAGSVLTARAEPTVQRLTPKNGFRQFAAAEHCVT